MYHVEIVLPCTHTRLSNVNPQMFQMCKETEKLTAVIWASYILSMYKMIILYLDVWTVRTIISKQF